MTVEEWRFYGLNRRCRGVAFCLVGVALVVALLVYGLSLGASAATSGDAGEAFQWNPAFTTSPFYLEMTCDRGEIRYTLDSTEPNEHSLLYTGPILIEDASDNPNVYSMIEDVCIELRTDILEIAGREPKYGFKTPVQPVDKATVIRAVCIDAFGNRSDIVNGVYFVGFDQKPAYDGMNIISITTNPENLFDFERGIYVLGKAFDDTLTEGAGVPPALDNFGNWAGNYKNRGKDWEREAHICFFDASKEPDAVRRFRYTHTGGRQPVHAAQEPEYLCPKALWHRIHTGAAALWRGLAAAQPEPERRRPRRGDKDPRPAGEHPGADCDVLTREYEPYELFLDGEYWGVYWLTPRFKEDYFQEQVRHSGRRRDRDQGRPHRSRHR